MARKSFPILPLGHIYDLSQGAFNANPLAGQWPSMKT